MESFLKLLKRINWTLLLISTVLIVASFLTLDIFFSWKISDFTIEILAAVVSAVIITGTLAITLLMQSQHEKEKEYSVQLFISKLNIYQNLLDTIFRSDDDNVLEKKEIMDIENKIGLACLVANEELVNIFAQFAFQLKVFGLMYYRSMSVAQVEKFLEILKEEYVKIGEYTKYNKDKDKIYMSSFLAKDQFEKLSVKNLEHLENSFKQSKDDLSKKENDLKKLKKQLKDTLTQNGIKDIKNQIEKKTYEISKTLKQIGLRDYFVSLDAVIQGVRKDLDVVDGEINNSIEHFLRESYNPFNVFNDPNEID